MWNSGCIYRCNSRIAENSQCRIHNCHFGLMVLCRLCLCLMSLFSCMLSHIRSLRPFHRFHFPLLLCIAYFHILCLYIGRLIHMEDLEGEDRFLELDQHSLLYQWGLHLECCRFYLRDIAGTLKCFLLVIHKCFHPVLKCIELFDILGKKNFRAKVSMWL